MPAACVTSTNRMGPDGRMTGGGTDAFWEVGLGEAGAGFEASCGFEGRDCGCLQATMPEHINNERLQAIKFRRHIRF